MQAASLNFYMKYEQKNNCSEGGIRTLKTLFLRQVCMPVPSLRQVTTRTDSNRDATLVRSQKHFHLCYGWLLGERWGSNPQIPDSQSGDFTNLSTITILDAADRFELPHSESKSEVLTIIRDCKKWQTISPSARGFESVNVTPIRRKGCQIRTGELLLPRQARTTGLLQSLINKKASQLREAYSYLKSINTIVPYQYLIDVAERVGVLMTFSWDKYNSFALNRARGYNYFFASLNVNMKNKSFHPIALLIHGVSGSVHREGLATRGTASMPEALFRAVALPLMYQV